jgi:hypothetical protein
MSVPLVSPSGLSFGNITYESTIFFALPPGNIIYEAIRGSIEFLNIFLIGDIFRSGIFMARLAATKEKKSSKANKFANVAPTVDDAVKDRTASWLSLESSILALIAEVTRVAKHAPSDDDVKTRGAEFVAECEKFVKTFKNLEETSFFTHFINMEKAEIEALYSQGTEAAILEAHAAGLPTTHIDEKGIYDLYPDGHKEYIEEERPSPGNRIG